jgi:hypothetical protein
MKQSLNVPEAEEPPAEISPAADAAMRELVELFSDPNLPSKARFRCSIEGPTEFDLLFESIIDDQFGYDPNSEYKNWVRRLYSVGLISRIPSEWESPSTPDGKSRFVTTCPSKKRST